MREGVCAFCQSKIDSKWKNLDVCSLKRDSLQRHAAATGFAGISTDAALPLSKAASVLSRVSTHDKQEKNISVTFQGWLIELS